MIVTSRAALAEALWMYGEKVVAKQVLDCPAEVLQRIFVRAAEPDLGTQDSLVERLLSLAAVEVLTGESRPLQRQRQMPHRYLAEARVSLGTESSEDDELQAALGAVRPPV